MAHLANSEHDNRVVQAIRNRGGKVYAAISPDKSLPFYRSECCPVCGALVENCVCIAEIGYYDRTCAYRCTCGHTFLS